MKKVLKNVLASALPQIMNIITNLLLPGLIIANYGSEINGLITSTKVIVAYISIVGAGIATATTQAMYEPVAKKDVHMIKGMLHATSDMFNKFGIVYCLIALVAALIYPLFIDTTISYFIFSVLIIVVSISGASEFFAIGRCRSFLYANQKTYVCTIVQAISLFFSLILALIMLKLHTNIVLVQLSISCVYVFRAFLLTSYINTHYPEIKGFKEEKPIKAAVEKRGDAMIHQLSGLAVQSSQPTILTFFLGFEAASIYSVYNIVFSGLQSICANLSTAITPFMGKEYALKNNNKLLKIYDLTEYAFFNLVSLIYSVSIVLVVPFVSIYTRNADISYIYPTFAFVFTLSSAFYILKLPSNALINISGQFKETRWRAILEAVLTVVLSIVFTMLFGIVGVVIGTAIALLWRCIDTIVYTNKRILACRNFKSLFRFVRTILLIILFYIFSYVRTIQCHSYIEWIKYAIVYSIVSILVICINSLIFDKDTLKTMFFYLKKKYQ